MRGEGVQDAGPYLTQILGRQQEEDKEVRTAPPSEPPLPLLERATQPLSGLPVLGN